MAYAGHLTTIKNSSNYVPRETKYIAIDDEMMKDLVCEGDFLNCPISSWIELFGGFPSANADKANTIASILSVI